MTETNNDEEILNQFLYYQNRKKSNSIIVEESVKEVVEEPIIESRLYEQEYIEYQTDYKKYKYNKKHVSRYLPRTESEKEESIYILKLRDNKWYVGYSKYSTIRIREHFTDRAVSWTHTHKPTEIAHHYRQAPKEYEDEITLELMKLYGVPNVRGGKWYRSKLNYGEISEIYEKLSKTAYYHLIGYEDIFPIQ